MIKYLKIDKVERANVMEKALRGMPMEQGRHVQNLAIALMERDLKPGGRRIDYTTALEIVMELGANFAERRWA